MTTSVPHGVGVHDDVTMHILANFFKTTVNEAEAALVRAAYSPIIKESFDCSVAIVSPAGEYWAQADAVPGQLGVLAPATVEVIAKHAATHSTPLRDGDIVLSNDPYLGCPHLNDFVSVQPVYAEGILLCYVATLAHYTDIGGKTPGSMPADATEIYQEGIRLPPRLIMQDGAVDESTVELLMANSRTPDFLRGDLHAQIAASSLATRSVLDAVRRYGAHDVVSYLDRYLDYTERLIRAQLNAFRPGHYTASRPVDWLFDEGAAGDGAPAHIVVDLTVSEDGLLVDFSRSIDQVDKPINAVASNAEAAALGGVRAMLEPHTPITGGLQRVYSTATRAGSILDPVLPAPVGARAIVAAAAFHGVVDCLGQAYPPRAAASSSGGSTMPYTWMSTARNGAKSVLLVDNSLRGGAGATATSDGGSAIDNSLTNATNYPAEVLEQDYPVRIERNEIRRGSGGNGVHRGGDGLTRAVRFLEPGVLSIRGHHDHFPPQGSAGGHDGAPAEFWLRRDGVDIPLPGTATAVPTLADDVFIAHTPGGGGYGSPTV
jgi:N-methylhydantoinase B/oxoprolinase/acetone carboxylase alpha subunit